MKKLLFLILLFSVIKVFAVSPPVIQNPTPLVVCDINNDGFAVFDLTPKISEVLGALNPSLYTVTFHETQNDAAVGGITIPNPASFVNITPFTQTVYVRVQENLSGEYSITTLDLSLNPTPIIGQPQNISIEQIPFTGTAVFNLTFNNGALVNGAPNVTVSYYVSLADAQVQVNQISVAVGLDPAAFIGTNGQIIWARVGYTSGCASFASFHLYITNPNIVFIPDANFKNKLVSTVCADFNNDGIFDGDVDTNNDGEIQVSEALAVYRLFVANTSLPSPNSISDLTGIESFINLVNFNCSLNTIHVFNFNISTLQTLSIGNNGLTTFQLSGIPNLLVLDCAQNTLSGLSLTTVPQLTSLGCDYAQLTTLDLSPVPNLTSLSARGNLLTALNLTVVPNLTSLQLDGNLFTPNVSGLVNLQSLGCANMGLSSLDLTNNVNLTLLSMNGNNFTAYNFPSLPLLTSLFFGETSTLISLNVNQLTALLNFHCINNSNMTHLFMKNGATVFGNLELAGNSNLQFLCADDFNVNGLIQNLAFNGITGVNVCSYCSFTPGGNYNTVKGTITFDADNNGCDASDILQPNIRVNINDGTTTGASFTNNSGNYQFYTQSGSFDITPDIDNPSWFTFSPTSATIPFANNNNNTVTQNFCIAANGIHPDVEVVIEPIVSARPGFDAQYKVVYKNKGNQTLSGNVTFGYNDNVLDFVSSSVAPDLQATGLLTYDYTNLLPFENRSFYITIHVNGPTDTQPVNIGDQLDFTSAVNPLTGDENPADNTFQYSQTVVGSFDPNEIECLEGNIVSPAEIGNYLHYVINFENTGTADAENIVVRDVIDTTQFDVDSLQLLNSSAPVTAKLTGNIAEFIFQNVNLHSGGHGNILIKIKSKNTLVQGDTVSKKANIYFDYNAPINTNLENTIFQTLSSTNFEHDNSISIYPNPTKGNVNINCNNTIKSVQLYDVQGRLLQTNLVNENQTVIDISNQSTGIYFLKITSEKGIGVQKIVRE